MVPLAHCLPTKISRQHQSLDRSAPHSPFTDPAAMIASHSVEVRDLVKRYGRTLALDCINLDVRRRELLALLGPNGAGKTTLLHILCALLPPDSGTVRIDGI